MDIDTKTRPTARGRRTRAALVQAAREVFEESGFRDARIADIAARAGASYGSFYTYFDSKGAIFSEVANQMAAEMFLAWQVPAEVSSPVARIEAANRQFLAAYSRHKRIIRVLEEMAPYDEAFRRLRLHIRDLFIQRGESGIRRLQEAGLADPELDPRIAASALGGMVEHFAHLWFLLGEEHDEERAIETLTRLWAQAIGLAMPEAVAEA